MVNALCYPFYRFCYYVAILKYTSSILLWYRETDKMSAMNNTTITLEDFFSECYLQYYDIIKRYITFRIDNSYEAEDLVQDVFISLLESDYKFKTENDIKYFLYSSLKNRCISHSRKQKVRDKYYRDVLSSQNEEEHFWDKVLEEDVYARLMAAIETLPPQCKLVMMMTLDGLKASEIAERLHISVDTVKDHKSNGKKKLTAQLKDAELLCLIGFLWL